MRKSVRKRLRRGHSGSGMAAATGPAGWVVEEEAWSARPLLRPGSECVARGELTPAVGAEIDAVVVEVSRWDPPVGVRLSIHPDDLEPFQRRCDFCSERTTLSPGGDGVVLDVRSNDGPGSHSIISHRACLTDSLHPTSLERRRVASVGRD